MPAKLVRLDGAWVKLVIKLAVDQPKLAACIVNYGWLPSDPAGGENQSAHAGKLRRKRSGNSSQNVKAFEAAMKADGKSRRHQDL